MANTNTIAIQLTVKDDGSVAIKQFASNAGQAMKDTETSVGSANSALGGMMGKLGGLIDQIKTHWLAATVAVAGMSYELKKAIDASLEMERITFTMKAVAGSSAGAAAAFQYVKAESERLGLALSDTSLAYAKFAAATKNTALEGEGTKKVFSGVSEAVTALKLPTEAANGIFLALSQMMSKGRMSAEELSSQLAERLPGAVKLTADAMGMSTKELLKHMENGELMSEDVLPKLADQLHKTYGAAAMEAAQGGQADINRFNNVLFETRAAIGDAVIPVFTDLLKLIGSAGAPIQAFIGGLKMSFVELYGFVDKTMAIPKMIKSAFTGANTNDMSEYGQFGTELYGAAGPEKHLSEWGKISTNVKAQKDAIYNQMTRNADLAQSAPVKELSAQEKATKKIIELTQEAAGAIKKKNSDTYAGAEKLLVENIAKYRLAGANEKAIAEYSATQRTLINQKYHAETEKAAKSAQKTEEQTLSELTKLNKETYDKAIANANQWLMVQRDNGAYEADLIDEYYDKKNDAMYESYSMEWDYINRHIKNESEKQVKLAALDAEYSKKVNDNETENLKNRIEAAKKTIEVEASLYKTINQYSDASVAAEIAAIGKKYKEAARYSQDELALLAAQEQEERNALAKRDQAVLSYYQKTGIYGADANDKIVALAWDEYDAVFAATKNEEAAKKAFQDFVITSQQAMVDATKKASLEKLVAAQTLYKDLQGYEGQYYETSKKLIEEKAINELFILTKGLTDKQAIADAERLIADVTALRYKRLEIEKGKASNDFFAGLRASIDEMELKQKKWGSVGVETMQAMCSAMSSTFATAFEDVYQGKMQSIGDYSKAIWDSTRQAFFKAASDMGSQAIMIGLKTQFTPSSGDTFRLIDKLGQLGGWAYDLYSTWSSGSSGGDLWDAAMAGYAGGGHVPGQASYGGNHPGNDTVLARLSPGEFVVPRTGVNSDTKEVLEYIRSFGKVPGFYEGGPTGHYETSQPRFDDSGNISDWGGQRVWVEDAIATHTPVMAYGSNPYDEGRTGWYDAWGTVPTGLWNKTTDQVLSLLKSYNSPSTTLRVDYSANMGIGDTRSMPGGAYGDYYNMYAYDKDMGAIRFLSGYDNSTPNQATGAPWTNLMYPIAMIAAAVSGGMSMGAMTAADVAAMEAAAAAMSGTTYAGLSVQGLAAYLPTSAMSTYASAAMAESPELAGAIAAEASLGSLSQETLAAQVVAMESAGYSATPLLRLIASQMIKGVMSKAAGGASSGIGAAGSLDIGIDGISGGEGIGASLNELFGTIPRQKIFSAETGLDFIPRDNTLVNTHKGEAILNESAANQWRSGGDASDVLAELRLLRADLNKAGFVIAKNTNRYAKMAEKWDVDGLPPVRT